MFFPKPKIIATHVPPSPTNDNVLGANATAQPSTTTTQGMTKLFGFALSDYTNKTEEISDLEDTIKKNITTVSIYKQFGLPSNNTIDITELSYIKSHNIKLLIAWEPWNPQEGMHQSIDYLKSINDGGQDAYIKSFAHIIQTYGAPVIIRFGHEMNGNWYPWGQRQQEYVHAYQRVVTLFRNENISNVQWMWSINVDPLTGVDSYYPGNDFVDIIGIDGFNFGTSAANTTWVSFYAIFSHAYEYIVSHYNKPLIISETASAEVGGNKAQWVRDMFGTLETSMPKIQEVIWFNLNKETDWRINSSSEALSAFLQGL